MSANAAILRNRNYLYFLAFRVSMVLGFQVVATIAQWQIYAATHDSIYIGYLALCEVIPAISLSLIGGYWSDSFNRRFIAICGTLISTLSVLVLLLFAAAHELNSILPLYIAVTITGVARGLLGPSSTALLGEIVAPDLYARAAVFNSIGWHIALITGPAMAGLLFEATSPLVCYRVAFALALLSLGFLFLVHAPGRPNKKRERLSTAVGEGLKFVFRTQVVLGAMSLDMFAVLFGGAIALLPAFCDQIYLTGASGLGVLRGAPAIGAATMGLLLIFVPIRRHAGRVLLTAVATYGILMIVFGINKDFRAAILILALSGAVDNISVVMRSTILQTHTPDAMRGRVAAVNSIFIASSNEIGAFESGLAAKLMGLVPSVVFGGSMTILVVAVVAMTLPKLRNLSFAATQK